jgi:hypothetical protein
MKYLKKYTKIFEEIHPLNTNINELDENFVSNIIDICADLGDQFPQSDPDRNLVEFYSTYFRTRLKDEPLEEYPSISITPPYIMYGYRFGKSDREFWPGNFAKECDELKEVALRIKEFLGDAYIGFVAKGRNFNLNDDTTLYNGISGFQIVYDPSKL